MHKAINLNGIKWSILIRQGIRHFAHYDWHIGSLESKHVHFSKTQTQANGFRKPVISHCSLSLRLSLSSCVTISMTICHGFSIHKSAYGMAWIEYSTGYTYQSWRRVFRRRQKSHLDSLPRLAASLSHKQHQIAIKAICK